MNEATPTVPRSDDERLDAVSAEVREIALEVKELTAKVVELLAATRAYVGAQLDGVKDRLVAVDETRLETATNG